jgi:hypothetical protein
MPSLKIPWREIHEFDRKRYQPLVDYFIPAVRLKPLDLWVNFRVHHRIAISKSDSRWSTRDNIQLAIYYIWDAPTRKKLEAMRPGWSSFTIDHWLERFERHRRRWGPGDVEFVKIILERKWDVADSDSLDPSNFIIAEIEYRTGAHVQGVLKQAWEGDWDKLGNKRVLYTFSETPLETMDGRIVLTVDSYHHSFYEPGRVPERALRWPSVIIPRSTYFPEKSWDYFEIVGNNRGSEAWQIV